MAKNISPFFEELGVPFKAPRWPWGAAKGNVIVLRVWADDYWSRNGERGVAVLHQQTLMENQSAGLGERVRHLQAIWEGGIAAYLVIATADDSTNTSIKSFREDLFPIDRLSVDAEGTVHAHYSHLVTPSEFRTHAESHRTVPGEGTLPVNDSATDLDVATVNQKLPHMREWLISVARSRGTASYRDMMQRYGLWMGTLFTSLKLLGEECLGAGEPILSSLLVNEAGKCSVGFFKLFTVNDRTERRRCYTYWAESAPTVAPNAVKSEPITEDTAEKQRDVLCARFMNVEVRTQQAAFRRAVYLAYQGRCAVSGCDIPEALEAAHKQGRVWREGHNNAEDGILLRRDLHTLYDRKLLDIDGGVAVFDTGVQHHYRDLNGADVFCPVSDGT